MIITIIEHAEAQGSKPTHTVIFFRKSDHGGKLITSIKCIL